MCIAPFIFVDFNFRALFLGGTMLEIPASDMIVELQYLTWLWNSSVWNDCGISVSQIAVEFQCHTWLWDFRVSHGCEIPVSRMVVEFQCLTWLWDFRCYHVRHWNSTAMWDPEISLPCERLEFHSHARHWNSTVMWDTQLLILDAIHIFIIRHFSKVQLYETERDSIFIIWSLARWIFLYRWSCEIIVLKSL
jgi:hypothetical protein